MRNANYPTDWTELCLEPRRRKWQPTPVFLPGESHGQRSVVGYHPRGCKESDTTKWLTHMSRTKISWLLVRYTFCLDSYLLFMDWICSLIPVYQNLLYHRLWLKIPLLCLGKEVVLRLFYVHSGDRVFKRRKDTTLTVIIKSINNKLLGLSW